MTGKIQSLCSQPREGERCVNPASHSVPPMCPNDTIQLSHVPEIRVLGRSLKSATDMSIFLASLTFSLKN